MQEKIYRWTQFAGTHLGAAGDTFLSALRSHLGQKELIPVRCDRGKSASVNSAYVKDLTVTNGINFTVLLTHEDC